MSLGPVMIDLAGTSLRVEEREMLSHPQVGGVILFTRNFSSVAQLKDLVRSIHELVEPHLLIAVDQEGGRVQRFREGFTRLPPAGKLGEVFDRNPKQARIMAQACGWLMAKELRSVGVDFSFAPVLDLGHGISGVIGDRAYHRRPEAVADLAHYVMIGMRRAGMEAVAKHFPGHGSVREDSHVAVPVDERALDDILSEDVLPFERMIHYGVAGIMPAHVIYSEADTQAAGFSSFWLHNMLRNHLGFQGAIFSDDLSMEAAHVVGDFPQRAKTALDAGCDMVLVCNHPEGVAQVLDLLPEDKNIVSQVRLVRFHGRKVVDYERLRRSDSWRRAVNSIRPLLGDVQGYELNL
ncbi:MAG: beta-N-acetylhexosaminidase [Pseudomonadota bacterium]